VAERNAKRPSRGPPEPAERANDARGFAMSFKSIAKPSWLKRKT
jgi:hypothetical protein